jgi:DNA-binding MarR family transcriptional regulator
MSNYTSATDGTVTPNYDFLPTVMIYSDTQAGLDEARSSAETVGARIGHAQRLDQVTRLESGDAIVLDVSGRSDDNFDHVLDQIEALADERQTPATISVPLDLLDRVYARVAHSAITILCNPTPLDRAAALSVALAPRQMHVTDVNTELESIRLRRLADEVGRIAKALSNLSSTTPAPQPLHGSVSDMISSFTAEPMFDALVPEAMTSQQLRNIIRVRRLRDKFFDSQLFADPAWDMLLDLMAAQLERIQVAVSSLCIAAAVPPTTALRWIKTMTDAGLLERVADPDDGRRIFIQLSESAGSAMQRYFSAVAAIPARII